MLKQITILALAAGWVFSLSPSTFAADAKSPTAAEMRMDLAYSVNPHTFLQKINECSIEKHEQVAVEAGRHQSVQLVRFKIEEPEFNCEGSLLLNQDSVLLLSSEGKPLQGGRCSPAALEKLRSADLGHSSEAIHLRGECKKYEISKVVNPHVRSVRLTPPDDSVWGITGHR